MKNSIINIIGAIFSAAILLVAVPRYISEIGESRYAIVALVWLIVGYFSMLEFGMGKAINNAISKASPDDFLGVGGIFWSGLACNFFIGFVCSVLMMFFGGYFFEYIYSVDKTYLNEVNESIFWISAAIPVSLCFGLILSALDGKSFFVDSNVVNILNTVFVNLLPLVVISFFGPNIKYILMSGVISRLLLLFFSIIWFIYRSGIPWKPSVNFRLIKKIFRYARWVAVTSILGPVLDTVDRLIIGKILGAKELSFYLISVQLVGKVSIIPSGVARALFPKFSSASDGAAKKMAVDGFIKLSVVMTIITVVGFFCIKLFLSLWISENFANKSEIICKVLLVGVWFNGLSHIPYFYLQGIGRPDSVAKVHFFLLVPYLLVLFYFIDLWGIVGAAASWSLRVIVEFLFLVCLARLFVLVYVATLVGSFVIVFSFWLSCCY